MNSLRKVNSVVFVPLNAQKIERLFEKDPIEEELMTIEEKVARDPFSRETILFRASLSGGGGISAPKRTISKREGSSKSTETKVYSGKKEFLKNMTDSTIIMQLNRKMEVDNRGRPLPGQEPYVLKRFLHKSKLTKEDLECYELQSLIESGSIEEITKQQHKEEMEQMPEIESEIEKRKSNPKAIGSAGVSMGSSRTAFVENNDGPTISFGASDLGSGEPNEMDILIKQALNSEE